MWRIRPQKPTRSPFVHGTRTHSAPNTLVQSQIINNVGRSFARSYVKTGQFALRIYVRVDKLGFSIFRVGMKRIHAAVKDRRSVSLGACMAETYI